jgi:predicted lactoylglutathione lyase
MAVPARMSVATLGVRDVQAMRAFYEGLGWKSNSPPGGDFAAFPLGGAVLGIFRAELLAGEASMEAAQLSDAFKGFTLAINVETREEVDAAITAAAEAGATVLAEPTDREWGGRSAYFADPERNVWEVAWLPNSEFDERGALIWPY